MGAKLLDTPGLESPWETPLKWGLLGGSPGGLSGGCREEGGLELELRVELGSPGGFEEECRPWKGAVGAAAL